MKKLVSLLLALIICLSFAACGDTIINIDGNKENALATTKEISRSSEFSLGSVEGTKYYNDFLGMGFDLPDGWNFYSNEEIASLNKTTTDALDNNLASLINTATIFYAMQASDNSGNSVNINFEKLPQKDITEEAYVENSLSSLEAGLKQIGYTSVTADKVSINLLGETHTGVNVVATSATVTVHEKIICIKLGDYMANMTVATVNKDTTNTILAQFYAL